MAEVISVEVVFALPAEQLLVSVSLDDGATVADAIGGSNLAAQFPDVDLDALQAGIWGRPVSRTQRVCDGDRVELYRPLQMDPRETRRELAQSGLTMRDPADDE